MKRRILLVDDTQTVIMFEQLMLGRHYEVAVAKNGLDALAQVSAAPPDLILLDIMMPELDGIETCRRLKGDDATRHIPVIMVTTKGEAEKVEASFMAGCDDYLTKPLDRLTLLEKVRSYLD